MEKIALKIGGVLFIVAGAVHALRVVKNVPVTIGQTELPMAASVFFAIAAIALGLWMLKLTCCCCKK